jgi:hypothetical protein
MLYAFGFERVVEVTRRLLEKVRSGELGQPPGGEPESSDVVRAGWP